MRRGSAEDWSGISGVNMLGKMFVRWRYFRGELMAWDRFEFVCAGRSS